MFEQRSYETEQPAPPVEQEDLFRDYEIKGWTLTPQVYKILAASVIFNLLGLFVVGQTQLLTRRGCESPFVGRVCSVLDTVYVGAILFGTDRQYVDEAYERTDLGDAEITFIDVSGVEPQFTYPAGYFYKDPAEMAAMDQFAATPGFPNASGFPTNPTIPTPGNELINTPQVVTPPNPNAVKGAEPDSPFSIESANTPNKRGRVGGRPVDPANANVDSEVAKNGANSNTDAPKVDPLAPIEGVKINREPMRDFARTVLVKLDKGEVELSRNFKVTAEATLTEEGKMDISVDEKTKLPKSRILTSQGDPQMVQVVTDAIAAIGDSGWLGYLSLEGIDKIRFSFSQDNDVLLVDIVSEDLTPNQAKKVSSRLTNAISAALMSDQAGFVNFTDDEKALLKAATVTAQGKQVVLNFKLPKPVAQEMINRNIQQARDAATGKSPSGQLQNSAGRNSAAR